MRQIVYAFGAFIFGAVTCIAYLIAFAFYIGIFLTLITGVWGGFLWGILWLFVGFGISFLLVSLLSLPIRGIGALLMYLARGPEWKEYATGQSEEAYPRLTHPEPARGPTYKDFVDKVSERSLMIGNSTTGVYHLPHCPHAPRAESGNAVTFQSPREAWLAGFHPCKKCNPGARGDNIMKQYRRGN